MTSWNYKTIEAGNGYLYDDASILYNSSFFYNSQERATTWNFTTKH